MGLAFLITTENLQLLGERKVLKEAEYAALLDAAAVVEAARGEARRIVAQGQQQADASRHKGYQEGLKQAQAEYAQRLVSEALAIEQQLQALRASMAQIVVKAVNQFIGELDPDELFEAALLRVDSLIRNEPYVTVRVAPAQEAGVREVLMRLRDEAQWSMPISLAGDPSLPPGACVLQTASGTLDLGVEAQLEVFRRAVQRSGLGAVEGTAR